ncbi:MAG: tetraacyldisaccharide 4'-kinase [Bacteroidetes bacterium]|nr:tetraacyldisaccharide 4'-kinase [Bacteroidota bacterium]
MGGLRLLLLPVAWIYQLILIVRHKLFDWQILRPVAFQHPVICVGNLSMGGTGKTPQVEYIIRLLKNNYRIATLSRGYRRKSSGFLLASNEMTYQQIGDEPKQYINKFDDIIVAVDEKRVHGIRKLQELPNPPKIVILDDAFQHRQVKPGINILLTDFHNLYPNDWLFPAGNLRDLSSQARRANVIIVTKTPRVFSPFTKRRLIEIIRPQPGQMLYFSYLDYGRLTPVNNKSKVFIPKTLTTILMFCGIGNPYPFEEHLRDLCSNLIVHDYPDHHVYTENDIKHLEREFEAILGKNKIMVTTEKDAMRLIDSPYFSRLERFPLFYIPIEVKFHENKAKGFDQYLTEYVRKNTSND